MIVLCGAKNAGKARDDDRAIHEIKKMMSVSVAKSGFLLRDAAPRVWWSLFASRLHLCWLLPKGKVQAFTFNTLRMHMRVL